MGEDCCWRQCNTSEWSTSPVTPSAFLHTYPCWGWQWWCSGTWWSLWCCWMRTTGHHNRKRGENEIISEGMCEADFQSRVSSTSCPLTLSMFEAFGFRRRRRCRLMRREELCSVELLNLKAVCSGAQHLKTIIPNWLAIIQELTKEPEFNFMQHRQQQTTLTVKWKAINRSSN